MYGQGINQELGINTPTLYIRYNQQGPIVLHGEIYLVFGGKLYEKKIRERVAICIFITESFCCTPETNTT